jgi:hypothetical protein
MMGKGKEIVAPNERSSSGALVKSFVYSTDVHYLGDERLAPESMITLIGTGFSIRINIV